MREARWGALVALVVAACSSDPNVSDALYPACNGLSPEGLATEATGAGACPAHPTILVGQEPVGTACGSAADCKPYCCMCASGKGALVAQCESGSCLNGNDTCCLYAGQCSN